MQRDRIQNRVTIWLLIAVVAGMLTAPVHAAKVQLPEGTAIKVKFDPSVTISSGESVAGVPILIRLAEPITIAGQVIVDEGATGTAEIVEVEKAARGGKPGKISVKFVDLETKGVFKAPDDGRIKLSGLVEGKGKGKKTLSYLFIFGLFIKGGQGELPTNQIYTATVAESIILESE